MAPQFVFSGFCVRQVRRMPLSRLCRLILIKLALCVVSSQHAFASDTLSLVYPRPVSAFDRRSEYPLKLLELALQKSGKTFVLNPSSAVMNKARVTAELVLGNDINVGWMVTSIEREERLLPIRICIFKGLGGWRISLVTKDKLKTFAGVKNLDDLRKLKAGQQLDWPDTAILRASGIPVETTTTYDPLFQMLIRDRFDWFPRSIPEIWAEAEVHGGKGVVVDPYVLVRYPSAYYFFVNKKDMSLAKTIEDGLEKALKDGSFDKLFLEYHGDVLARANVKNRTIIDLPNPFLPPLTPLSRKDLWFDTRMLK